MTVSDTVNILTGIFEAIVIMMYISIYDEQNYKSRFLHIGGIILLAFLINFSNKFLNYGLLNLAFIAVSIFAVSFIYIKNIKTNILISIIIVSIFTISEILILFVITFLTGISTEQATVAENYRFLGIILSKLFAFIILKALCIHKNNSNITMKTSYWILFFMMFLTSTVTIYLLFVLQYKNNIDTIYKLLSVICSFGLLYSTFFSLYLYERLAEKAEIKSKQEILKQQIKEQSKRFDEIMITQNQLRKFRHDLTNHAISLQAFFESRSCESGLEYLKKMNDQLSSSESSIDTGNIVLDTIINTKKALHKIKE